MIEQANSTQKYDFDNYVFPDGNAHAQTSNEVIEDLVRRRDNILNGGINCLPLPFPRFQDEWPGIEQEQYIVFTASTKVGKCFGKGTRIRMADNTVKNIEDIRVGDWVMSPGLEAPKQVLSLGHGKEQMYRVSSEMHKDLIVNESHIMYLYNPRTKTYFTATIAELLALQQTQPLFYFKHSNKMVMSDECDFGLDINLPLEPYFYGLWLGDGDTDSPVITTSDASIKEYLENYAEQLGMTVIKYKSGNTRSPRYSIRRTSNKNIGFKSLVESVTCFQKEHINPDYLNASIQDRYELLAGIIDTNGHLNSHKTGYQITMQYLSCIRDIQQVAHSLGLVTTIREKYNKQYDKNYYEIRINGKNCMKIPTRVKKCRETSKDFKHYPFTITPIGEGEYYGLTIGGNHLFLLEDFTIVHNTQLASYICIYQTLDYAFEHSGQCNVDILYFPLEESIQRIYQRYMSYLLYKLDGYRLSPRDLRSTSADYPLPEEALDLLRSERYQERLRFFDEHVHFNNTDTNPTGIYNVCKKFAKTKGTYVEREIESGDGTGRKVKEFVSYSLNDPNQYTIVFVDHLRLLDVERGYTQKQAIDKFSQYALQYLRDRYHMTVVAIQQQAFETEGLEAIKQKRMEPSLSGLGDSKYTSQDANIIIGLFDPHQFGLPNWMGYKIQDADGTGLRTNARFMRLIRGRDGEQGGVCPLFFDGAVCVFEELPRPDDINAISQYYTRSQNLKSYRQQKKLSTLTLINFIKTITKTNKKINKKQNNG